MTLDPTIPPRPVLLTVSGVIPPALDESIEVGRRARSDYSEMAKAFDAALPVLHVLPPELRDRSRDARSQI